MLFDFQRAFVSPPVETVPGERTEPNLVIPPTGGARLSALTFGLYAPTGGNIDFSLYGLIETIGDQLAVDNFAEVQEQANEWVFINAVTVTHGATLASFQNLTWGRYYVRITAGTSANGKLLAAWL